MKILDCTLRDGSYAINFQFTASDTMKIASALDDAGIELIEVGHGVGLNASQAGFGEAAETDDDYLSAAAKAVRHGKFGVFCIPGVARLEDIDRAVGHNMGFIRIGTDIDDVRDAVPFIERARRHGLFVCFNLMKSYACPPQEFARIASLVQSCGAEVLYIVDSAGGMLPAEVEQYFTAVRERCDLPLAFHGHDNLGLAVHNSVRAVELGAAIVDSSLQGLGRSAGNAPTELLVTVLTRMGYALGVEPLHVMDIGEEYVRPLVQRRGLSSIDVISGLAQFHSSYMGIIRKVASKYQVDPRRLILEVCKVDRVNAPLALVERCAAQIKERAEVLTSRFHFEKYFGNEQVKKSA